MFNEVTIAGRLTKDPEIERLKDEKCKTVVSIAVQQPFKNANGEYDVEFFDIELWNATAEYLCKYTQKGARILFKGRLKKDTWTAPDGTNRSRVYVVADKAVIFDYKNDEEKSLQDKMKEVKQHAAQVINGVSEEDLPF